MSRAIVASLPAPLSDLVVAACQQEEDYGKTDEDKADVTRWIEKVAHGDITKAESTKELDAQLTPKTYLVNNYLTAADVAVYGALHPIFNQLQPAQYYSHPSLTRYFDHIQWRPSIRKAVETSAPSFTTIKFDLENAPKAERKPDPPKKKEKTSKASQVKASPAVEAEAEAEAVATKIPQVVTKDGAPPAQPKKEKGKKEQKGKDKPAPAEGVAKKAGGKGGAAPAEDAGEPVPSMIDLRVGHIVHIEKHPDADGLYVEQIDLGEPEGPRTVVSGLVHYIPIDQMRNRDVVAVCNLKPANMRGVKSFAMVLCATSKDGKEAGIELVQPPAGSKPGERVYFEGEKFESATPLSQLNPKKKIFETVQPGFTTLDTREAAWVDPNTKAVHKIRTEAGVCLAPTLVGASLS